MMLTEFFLELNQRHFSGRLPPCKLQWNSRLQTSAGRFHPGSRNPFLHREPLIEVASYLREIADGPKHIRDTILHEMIHFDLWHRKKPYGHTKEFYEIMKRTGAQRFNPVPRERPVKYWYECIQCRVRVPARRVLGKVACATCCKKFNRGIFSERYILQVMSPLAVAQEKLPSVALPPPEEIFLSYEKVLETLEAIRETIKKAKISSSPSVKLE